LRLLYALVVVGSTAPVWAQYAGPAILTRGEAPAAIRGAPITFRPFIELSGVYDTGLSGVGVVDPQGNLANSSAYGVEITFGVSGSHQWKHTLIGLDYRGSFRHYTEHTFYDGTDQAINLGLTHQVSRHVVLNLRESAGILSRNFGLLGLQQTVPFDPGTTYIPTTDYFDNRTFYLSSQADLTYQRTARLSFNLGGDYFANQRRSSALYDVTGESARGDVQYRIGRYTTIGANYMFSRFGFSKGFGDTNMHIGSVSYSVRFTKNLELSMYGGIAYVETKFIQSVALDPAIAAIVGQIQVTRLIYKTNFLPNYGGRLSRKFHNGIVAVSGSHMITPGNGLFLTSVQTNVGASYNYTGLRHWSAGLDFSYYSSKAISNLNGHYAGLSGGLHISRRLVHSLHFVTNFAVRQYSSQDYARYDRLIYRATIGFGWAPGDLPLRAW